VAFDRNVNGARLYISLNVVVAWSMAAIAIKPGMHLWLTAYPAKHDLSQFVVHRYDLLHKIRYGAERFTAPNSAVTR
jgi:hypothetical protein